MKVTLTLSGPDLSKTFTVKDACFGHQYPVNLSSTNLGIQKYAGSQTTCFGLWMRNDNPGAFLSLVGWFVVRLGTTLMRKSAPVPTCSHLLQIGPAAQHDCSHMCPSFCFFFQTLWRSTHAWTTITCWCNRLSGWPEAASRKSLHLHHEIILSQLLLYEAKAPVEGCSSLNDWLPVSWCVRRIFYDRDGCFWYLSTQIYLLSTKIYLIFQRQSFSIKSSSWRQKQSWVMSKVKVLCG